MLQTAPQINNGLVAVENGSATVAGSGMVFTSALVGPRLQAVGRPERYQIATVSSTR